MAGDIFLLGNTSWRIRRVEAGRVRVEDAAGAPPTIPFWLGEAPARTFELSEEVSSLRAEVGDALARGDAPSDVATQLASSASMPMDAAVEVVEYLGAARDVLGVVPTAELLVAERFFDEAGGMQLVLHAPLGGRINRAWGLALRKRFCRSFDFELQAAATDDGIVLSLGPMHSFPLETVFDFLTPSTVGPLLEQAVLAAPVFGVRWRWNAQRALAVPRHAHGRRVPPPILRMRTDDLLSSVFPMATACLENVTGDIEVPDHPLVRETMKDCLEVAMDLPGLVRVLEAIRDGRVRTVARDTAEPSLLAHELLNANPYAFLDDAPLEERRARAVSLRRRRVTPASDALGVLDADAIALAEAELEPAVRDADELHDLLLTLALVPLSTEPTTPIDAPRAGAALDATRAGSASDATRAGAASDAMRAASGTARAEWAPLFAALAAAGRAARVSWRDERGALRAAWVAAERWPLVGAALGPVDALTPALDALPFVVPDVSPEAARVAIVRGHVEARGPITARALADALGLAVFDVELALAALEAEGAVLRGRFTPRRARTEAPREAGTDEASAHEACEWCDRRILARIHHLTLARLRREIEPVTPAALMRFLFTWQHVAPGTQRFGAAGALEVITQLEGLELPAAAWSGDVLAARLADADAYVVDRLVGAGEVTWGRLGARDGAPAALTRGMPLALVLRDDLPWILDPGALDPATLSDAARDVLAALERHGASFLRELVPATRRLPFEVEDALRELVSAGWVTADSLSALSALVDRRLGEDVRPSVPSRFARFAGSSSGPRPQTALGGRWSLLRRGLEPRGDVEAFARLLLVRWGVVLRELLARETRTPPWRELLAVLRRMEARGEVRGGRFVSGFVGEQYALPEAVDALRAMRRTAERDATELVRLAATDPLNLTGIVTPGPRVAAIAGNGVLLRGGVPIASLEGGRVVVRGPLPEGTWVDEDLVLRPRSAPLRSPDVVVARDVVGDLG
jgi:ATP-dependent Lhr-like helicase